MERLADAVWVFARSMQQRLLSLDEDEAAFAADVQKQLSPALADDLLQVRHKPTRALQEISSAINDLPLDSFRRVALESHVSELCNACGTCERIFGSPVPLVYTRHTGRFLELWLLFLPLALYESFGTSWNHWGL